MQCISCAADIPEIWVSAINRNVCPNCDKNIMDETTHSLLKELREAMAKMQGTPEEIVGWLLTHYTLIKVGSGEAAIFHRPVLKEEAVEKVEEKPIKIAKPPKTISRVDEDNDIDEEIEVPVKVGDRTALFNKRAGVPDQKKLAEAVQRMKSASGGTISMQDVQSMENAEDDIYIDSEAIPVDEHSDVIKLLTKDSQELNAAPSKALEMEKLKTLRARSNFENGGGKFSRSG